MDEMNNMQQRPENPRRRKRSNWEIFKEAYLPVVIAGAALLLILIFIIGSIVRAVERSNIEREASIAASIAESEEAQRLSNEADALLAEASVRADMADYENAIAIVNSFSGNMDDYPALLDARAKYEEAQASLVAWDNPDDVLNLSFQLLIADPQRAFNDDVYGASYKKNFVTTVEFSKILNQLYDNDYILVRLSDFFSTGVAENGETVYVSQPLYLPEGKKPLILTQTNVNYNTYMVDSDGDLMPDKGADGFACKLIVGADGKLTNEYVDAQGNTQTGQYDLVPILNSFIEAHPDFSYRGARAVLAVTGYDGLFGYRTYPGIDDQFGTEYYNDQISGASAILDALRNDGYEIACYTYENVPYGNSGTAEIKADLQKWQEQVEPILGKTDILVLAQNSDISDIDIAYSGDKFGILKEAGFAYYIGFCADGEKWSAIATDHVRMGRILVTGANMQDNAAWFEGIFDPAAVLDSTR